MMMMPTEESRLLRVYLCSTRLPSFLLWRLKVLSLISLSATTYSDFYHQQVYSTSFWMFLGRIVVSISNVAPHAFLLGPAGEMAKKIFAEHFESFSVAFRLLLASLTLPRRHQQTDNRIPSLSPIVMRSPALGSTLF